MSNKVGSGVARRVVYIAVTAVVLIAVAAGIAFLQLGWEEGGSAGLLVVVTFPGLKSDVELIACSGDRVIEIYNPGVDPHEAQLDPRAARMVAEADIVVTGGHTPADLKAAELASGTVVDVTRIPGIEILETPDGSPNLHYPIYHPENYRLFLSRLAEAMQEKRPECDYIGNLRVALKKLEDLERLQGLLKGSEAVADHPAAQYPAHWLGAEVVLIIGGGEEWAPTVQELEKAERLLASGSVAFITVDDSGVPVSKAGEWLLREAERLGASVILVKAPYTEGSIIDKLSYIAVQIEEGIYG
ncbi:ABC transporter, substrate binding protein [Aeropyrum pernix K1]|uniref:ABC transporter, substrate binding protein n=1 Tax=Aeropyrum pernix (strain ATCC 700893 / DSM 11879 / JCM 9820 / NBRC 100138 / K1) TaxID=272557 RepID=Q9YEP8_AERPE|nr:zinc ABC transporter substrate-binding protein [Aeropyrum pernix]BAA79498.2 ABC transporter, substrate binding protein [Aeropyrum pernix K1]